MSPGAPRLETLRMSGSAGVLEGILRLPPTAPSRSALLCHPHPLYQGSLHSPVIFRAARAMHRRGYATLRFNFRGVGMSAGSYDGGRGEKEDVGRARNLVTSESVTAWMLWTPAFTTSPRNLFFGQEELYHV